MLKSRHFRRRIWLLAAFVLGATAVSHAFAGQTVVFKNGQPLAEAAVTFLTPAGKKLATVKTDAKGIAKTDLPEATESRRIVVKVEDKRTATPPIASSASPPTSPGIWWLWTPQGGSMDIARRHSGS